MPRYKHMLSEDTAAWTRFLESRIITIKRVWYDVRVGSPVVLDVAADDVDTRIAAGLTRKRIDVVAEVGGGYWVIEVKPHANMYAVGQVLTYRRLFIQEFRPASAVVAVIVADTYDGDLVQEIDDFGILLIANIGKM